MNPAPHRGPSTLLTNPVSFADFVFRLIFFTLAPFGIVAVAELFPVRGALIDVALALVLFIGGEAARRFARRLPAARFLVSEALAFETHYRERPPRPFAYYFFYPLLFPYWLVNREARREFLVFRGYTAASFAVLVVSLVVQYWQYWAPELSVAAFLPFVGMALAVETLLVLSLLMPIATTVVWYHSSFRRGRLAIVLAAGLLSTTVVLVHVSSRRHPIVSYSARQRVVLRTEAARAEAHRALRTTARAAFRRFVATSAAPEGQLEGDMLDAARDGLDVFYKPDEVAAFSVWTSPMVRQGTLLLYFKPTARSSAGAIWVVIGPDGREIRKPSELPRAVRRILRHGDEDEGGGEGLPIWAEDVELPVP